ncbi:MAG: YtcA family lipoprotein [Candidatus Binataceae bacterium]
MTIRRLLGPVTIAAALAPGALALSGCDPVVNIAGANFPAWLLCAIVGAILAAAVRPIFTTTGIEPHLGPLVVIYPCLTVLLACVVWIVFFNRV